MVPNLWAWAKALSSSFVPYIVCVSVETFQARFIVANTSWKQTEEPHWCLLPQVLAHHPTAYDWQGCYFPFTLSTVFFFVQIWMIQISKKLGNIQSGVLLQRNHKWRLIPDGKEEWDLVMSSWELRHRHICSQKDSLKICIENFLERKRDLQQRNFGWKKTQRREGVHTTLTCLRKQWQGSLQHQTAA